MIDSTAGFRSLVSTFMAGGSALDDFEAALTELGEQLPGISDPWLPSMYGAVELAIAEFGLGHLDESEFLARLREVAPVLVTIEPGAFRVDSTTGSASYSAGISQEVYLQSPAADKPAEGALVLVASH